MKNIPAVRRAAPFPPAFSAPAPEDAAAGRGLAFFGRRRFLGGAGIFHGYLYSFGFFTGEP
ncbi:MAG: hypothetical protein LBL44_08060 [Treponema sp.]|nr:hypothetical protein [Treponema sp.]